MAAFIKMRIASGKAAKPPWTNCSSRLSKSDSGNLNGNGGFEGKVESSWQVIRVSSFQALATERIHPGLPSPPDGRPTNLQKELYTNLDNFGRAFPRPDVVLSFTQRDYHGAALID